MGERKSCLKGITIEGGRGLIKNGERRRFISQAEKKKKL